VEFFSGSILSEVLFLLVLIGYTVSLLSSDLEGLSGNEGSLLNVLRAATALKYNLGDSSLNYGSVKGLQYIIDAQGDRVLEKGLVDVWTERFYSPRDVVSKNSAPLSGLNALSALSSDGLAALDLRSVSYNTPSNLFGGAAGEALFINGYGSYGLSRYVSVVDKSSLENEALVYSVSHLSPVNDAIFNGAFTELGDLNLLNQSDFIYYTALPGYLQGLYSCLVELGYAFNFNFSWDLSRSSVAIENINRLKTINGVSEPAV